MKCPKCHSENPDDSVYCSKCATPLKASEGISARTKTLQVPMKELKVNSFFAGRYLILEELGKGGMGRVYKALDKEINEEVAIKLLKPEIAEDESTIERFRNELRLTRKISHKNVCRMYHLAKEEETPYITMEYVKGENLKGLIKRRGKIPEEEALSIAKQVCEGLAEAHELGVVHRDLKPQNIMIDLEGNAKIMDFGIARSVETLGFTQTGIMIGTPDYLSPEQAEGEETDQRSDIYSLGVILYEMATGSVPFKGDTALSVALKHKGQLPKEPRKLNPEISEQLSRLILACMEKDRERRYQKAEELLVDLRNIEEGFPLGTKIQPRRKTIVATLIRNKLFIPALVAALAIIAVVIWQPWSQKEAVPIPSDKPSLAILDFENYSGNENLNSWQSGISMLLIGDLYQSQFIRVLRLDEISSILKTLNLLDKQTLNSEDLKKIAEEGRVSHILKGGFIEAGDNLRIAATLISGTTGETIDSITEEAEGEEDIFPTVDELTKKIKANFRLSQQQIASDIDREVGKITTNSPEAYRYYIEGRKVGSKGEDSRCIEFMKKAIEVDPEFAVAYWEMGVSYMNLGNMSEGTKCLQKALELSGRISDREKYHIQASFYLRSEETYDKTLEADTKLLQLYPDDMLGNNNLGVLYLRLEEWDKAIERFEVIKQNKGSDIYCYTNQSRAYTAKGLYDKAIKVLEYYQTNFSDSATLRLFLAKNYLFQRKYDLALSEIDEALFLNPANHVIIRAKGDIYTCMDDLTNAKSEYERLMKAEDAALMYGKSRLAALNLLQGKYAKSKEYIRQSIEIEKKIGTRIYDPSGRLFLAYMQLQLGNHDVALEECERMWKIAIDAKDLRRQREALYFKGLAYLEKKSLAEAQKTADELREIIENSMNKKLIRLYDHLIGMIELKRENLSQAIEYLEKAASLLPYQLTVDYNFQTLFLDSLALAHYKLKSLESAKEQYKKIISLSTGRILFGDIYAKSFYMVGKIYEEQGTTPKAIEHYEKFLDLWKDADPGIAEVEDAKKRLVGLKSQ